MVRERELNFRSMISQWNWKRLEMYHVLSKCRGREGWLEEVGKNQREGGRQDSLQHKRGDVTW